jgi:hypothetical protein
MLIEAVKCVHSLDDLMAKRTQNVVQKYTLAIMYLLTTF